MMGRTHALSGLVLGAAAGQFVWHSAPGYLAVAAAVTAGAAVLPDLDHPDASIARSFGFVTEAFAWVVEHLCGGHRHGTHSLVGAAVFTGGAYAADHYRQSPAGKAGLALLLVLVLAAGLRALKIGGHFGDLIAIGGAAAMVGTGFGLAGVPWAIAVGTVTHLLGDMLTDEGIPVAWPVSRRRVRLLPEPFAFTTGTRPERWFVAPMLLAALAWLAWLVTNSAALVPGGRITR